MFGQGSTSPAMFGQQKRMQRYASYDGTIRTIDYCYRALDVLTDNICSPDDITKSALEIKPKKEPMKGKCLVKIPGVNC